MASENVDVVVIGAGAGGGACAWGLARRGVPVLVLEAGPAYDPAADFRLHRWDWEQSGFPAKVPTAGRQTFAPLQALEPRWSHLRSWNRQLGTLVAGDVRVPQGYSQVLGVGGSTLHFTGEAHRLHPLAMRLRTRFAVAADWPLSYADLAPYYLIAERVVGVAGTPEPTRPRADPYPLPAHPRGYASARLARGFAALGLSWGPNPLAVLSQPYDGRPPCNYCGGCGLGCPRGDKGSVDVTFLRQAAASGRLTLRPGCTAVGLDAGPRDRVMTLRYRDAAGQEQAVQARAFVVACGAVETPRLLLNSAGAAAPQGLGNESGQLGRHFMETLMWTSTGLCPEPLDSYRGLPADSICWDHNAPDGITGLIGGCRFSPATIESGLAGPIRYAQRVAGGWGKAHKARMRQTFGRALGLGAIGEHLPNADSFIDLDPLARDRFGLPLARIHSWWAEDDLRRLDHMARVVRAVLTASGIDELIEEDGSYDQLRATHVFGGCRMGVEPATSVVDPFGRCHRWGNLFVADASVFPTSGGGESPSLTIEALALRTADRIADLLGAGDL